MITGTQIIEWLAWGFFMGLGWSVATWLVNMLLSKKSNG